MNRFVRTAPPRRLLGVIVALVVLIALGSTLAVAASGGGPVPPAKPLPQAIHEALSAPPVNGIAANITLKNSLIDASELQGSDPLLAGGRGRLWLSDDHRFRLELQTNGGSQDAQLVVDHNTWWAYDPTSNTVYEGTLPAHQSGMRRAHHAAHESVPSVAKIQRELQRVMAHASLSGAIPSDIAGRPAYTVRVSPKDRGGLIGAAELAWDAVRGVPLRVALYARGDANPVLELAASNISYGPQPSSVFSITPPDGAKVVRVNSPHRHGREQPNRRNHRPRGRHTAITGAAAVAQRLPFRLDAPGSLAGRSRSSVRLLEFSGHPAAVVVYGRGLDSIAVLEQPVSRSGPSHAPRHSGDREGLSLPTIQVPGATGQELDTAIGTLVHFTRGGVGYTVVGSVPRSVADAAARQL